MENADPTPSQPPSSDTAAVSEQDVGADGILIKMKDEFSLPEGFLSRNVRSKSELDDLRMTCEIVADEEAIGQGEIAKKLNGKLAPGKPEAHEGSSAEGSDAKGGTGDDENNVLSEFQVSLDSFSELRDVTAAALVRDHAGKLPPSNPGVLIRWTKNNETHYINSVLAHLAKDLQATLVTAELEDLEDLGWEFDQQEREGPATAIVDEQNKEAQSKEEPDRVSLTGMTGHYFGARSKRRASENSWNRNRKAIEAVLDARRMKSKQQEKEGMPLRPEQSTTDEDTSDNDDSSPLLLHIYKFSDIMETTRGHRFIARFRDAVKEQRNSGRNVVLLVSLVKSGNGGEDAYAEQDKISKKISAGQASTVTVTVTSSSDIARRRENEKSGTADDKVDKTNELAKVNIRRLKRFMRWRIPHLFTPTILEALQPYQPFSAWEKHGFDAPYESLGATRWSEDDLQRSVTQITGRAFGKIHVDLKDVRIVLSRLGLCQEGRQNAGKKGKTWEEKLEEIREGADRYETALMDCIINPDDLQVSYDDVIMDEETKDAVRYLVSLSAFKPEAASKSLLQRIRIDGALFYGPPGTGKTHLSRAIAKASGSNMLAIDPASITVRWIGETERYIRAAFSLSAKLYPCVLFIDEVDALFYRRSSDDPCWRRNHLAQFLSEMDGLSQRKKSPFVLATTNRPADLDEAFFRRLPQKILFQLPDEDSRAKVLKLFLTAEDLDEELDVAALARQTEGYSGSDLKNLCAEATMIWAIEQVKKIPANGNGEERGSQQTTRVKLKLRSEHFAKALRKIRPSVSQRAMKEFQEFADRFNPGSSNPEAHVDGPLHSTPAKQEIKCRGVLSEDVDANN